MSNVIVFVVILATFPEILCFPIDFKQSPESHDNNQHASSATEFSTIPSGNANTTSKVWSPDDGRNLSAWAKCWGLDCIEWEQIQQTIAEIRLIVSSNGSADTTSLPMTTETPVDDVIASTTNERHVTTSGSDVNTTDGQSQTTTANIVDPALHPHQGPDILLTAEQATVLLDEIKAEDAHRRTRRKVASNLVASWSMPITYKFDGQYNDDEKTKIRSSIQLWESNTCVRFREVSQNETVTTNYLVVTKQTPGCSSFIGKVALPAGSPQMINLASECLTQIGVAAHEIGHALGLWHEHQRAIRDQYINVLRLNIASWAAANFQIPPAASIVDYGLPYDVNSVMHYQSQTGARQPGLNTIETKDPLMQRNIGQRDSLSFIDAKAINIAYCKDKCKAAESLSCLNGGYPDPNDCTRCRCPDGLAGTICDQPAASNSPNCGDGLIELGINDRAVISTPGYDDYQQYDNSLQCNYLVTVPSEGQILAEFVDEFHINSPLTTCMHWVELRYKQDLSLPGPRLCGDDRPTAKFMSEGSQILVTFRAPYISSEYVNRRGFKLQLRTVWRK